MNYVVVEEDEGFVIYDSNGDFIETFKDKEIAEVRARQLQYEMEAKGDMYYEQWLDDEYYKNAYKE